MKPAERKKLKEILKRRHEREAENLYFVMFSILIQRDMMIKKLMKEGHSKKEANKILKNRIFGS